MRVRLLVLGVVVYVAGVGVGAVLASVTRPAPGGPSPTAVAAASLTAAPTPARPTPASMLLPTFTPGPTSQATSAPTAVATPSLTPSLTVAPTATPGPTPAPTPGPTPGPTPAVTPEPTPAPTPGPTPTVSPSQSPATSPSPSADPADIPAFAADLARAIRTNDRSFLFRHLHPATLDRYGRAACHAYLAGARVPDLKWTYLDSTGPGGWDWTTDGRTTHIEDAWVVTIRQEQGGSTSTIQPHFAPSGGTWRWFTDCGAPLP
jgi:hypothetical protein